MLPLNWMRVTLFIYKDLFYVPNHKKNLASISKMEVIGFRVAFMDGKVHVKKYNFQRCFFSWVQGWQFVSSCRMVHWGPCKLSHLIYSTEGLLIVPYLMWVRWWQGCPNSRRAWKYMFEMYPRKILQGDHSPHVAGPQVWNNPRSLRFMIGNLMCIGRRKPSMAWSKTPRV